MPNVVRKPTERITIKLTPKERKLLLGLLIMDRCLEDRLKQVPPEEEQVGFDLDDLVALFGWLNAPGNQSQDEEVQDKLDHICDRIERLLPVDAVSGDKE